MGHGRAQLRRQHQPVALVANVVYNWQGDDWRPYVTGGGGLYRYGFKRWVSGRRREAASTSAPGSNTSSLGEARSLARAVHKVGVVPTNRAVLGFKGSFWSFAVGAKKYI